MNDMINVFASILADTVYLTGHEDTEHPWRQCSEQEREDWIGIAAMIKEHLAMRGIVFVSESEENIDAGAKIIHGNYSEEPYNFENATWARGTFRAAIHKASGEGF